MLKVIYLLQKKIRDEKVLCRYRLSLLQHHFEQPTEKEKKWRPTDGEVPTLVVRVVPDGTSCENHHHHTAWYCTGMMVGVASAVGW